MIKLFAEERKEKIIKNLNKYNRVQVKELSNEFNVSEVTIRRDLGELEEGGYLLRTHGGAVSVSFSKSYEPSFEDKADKFKEAKREIGYKASQLIKEGDTILIDAGTTTLQIVGKLKNITKLTLVTNSFDIFNEVKQLGREIEVVFIGGTYKYNTRAFVGSLAEKILKELRVDKAFLGSNGFTINDGFTTPDLTEASIKKAMIDIAQEVYMLVDHSKLEKVSFCKFAGLKDIDYFVTDQLAKQYITKIEEAGVEVIL